MGLQRVAHVARVVIVVVAVVVAVAGCAGRSGRGTEAALDGDGSVLCPATRPPLGQGEVGDGLAYLDVATVEAASAVTPAHIAAYDAGLGVRSVEVDTRPGYGLVAGNATVAIKQGVVSVAVVTLEPTSRCPAAPLFIGGVPVEFRRAAK